MCHLDVSTMDDSESFGIFWNFSVVSDDPSKIFGIIGNFQNLRIFGIFGISFQKNRFIHTSTWLDLLKEFTPYHHKNYFNITQCDDSGIVIKIIMPGKSQIFTWPRKILLIKYQTPSKWNSKYWWPHIVNTRSVLSINFDKSFNSKIIKAFSDKII